MKLSPCIACRRHIRETETRCPFCAAAPAILGLALLLGACETKPVNTTPPPSNTVAAPDPSRDFIPAYGLPPRPIEPTSTVTNAPTPTSAPMSAPASAPAPKESAADPERTAKEKAKADAKKKAAEERKKQLEELSRPRPMYGLPALPPKKVTW